MYGLYKKCEICQLVHKKYKFIHCGVVTKLQMQPINCYWARRYYYVTLRFAGKRNMSQLLLLRANQSLFRFWTLRRLP